MPRPMFAWPRGEQVTIVHLTRSGRDIYGDDTWTRTEEQVTGIIAPRAVPGPAAISVGGEARAAPEMLQGGEMIIIGLTLYLQPGTQIADTDHVIARGQEFYVDGAPDDWLSPFTGAGAGIQVTLTLITG